MSKRANPTTIGAFVLGALAIAVIGVVALGGRAWFTRPVTCVMAFDGSVAGLSAGAPVAFRGVPLGTVTHIQLRAGSSLIAVYVALEPWRIADRPRDTMTKQKVIETIESRVQQSGLRAQLQVQSLITGQLYVGLDYYPDTPVNLTGVDKEDCEIPTLPTTLAQFQETLKKVVAEIEQRPLKEIVISLARTLDGIDKFVQSGEVKKTLRAVEVTLGDAQRLVRNLDSKIGPTVIALQATLEQSKRTLDEVGRDINKLILNIDGQVGPLATNVGATSDAARTFLVDGQRVIRDLDQQLRPLVASLQGTSDSARVTLEKLQSAAAQVDSVLDGNSPLGYQLGEMLDELTRMARGLRALTDEIDRQPNVLIFGRGGRKD
jgi:phospholipid/cholesterol/gamma-HCH transport system substrate-binding protein